MERILDLTESRKARNEKSEQFRDAGQDLLLLLDQQREDIPEDALSFLLALAISDQAIHYATAEKNKQAGVDFMENLFLTARQLFETHSPAARKTSKSATRSVPPTSGLLLEFPPSDPAQHAGNADTQSPITPDMPS